MTEGKDVRKAFFTDLWQKYPESSPQTVGWGSEESQKVRFRVLAGVGEMRGSSILDVGCGFGDFLKYLWWTGVRPESYVGIDMMEKTISEAWKIHAADREHAAENVRFTCGNFLEWESPERFDYVIASGIFSIKTADWRSNVEEVLGKMYSMADRGVAVNFLSAMHEPKIETSMYAEPREILAMALVISERVTLIHGYRLNDFTVYIRK